MDGLQLPGDDRRREDVHGEERMRHRARQRDVVTENRAQSRSGQPAMAPSRHEVWNTGRGTYSHIDLGTIDSESGRTPVDPKNTGYSLDLCEEAVVDDGDHLIVTREDDDLIAHIEAIHRGRVGRRHQITELHAIAQFRIQPHRHLLASRPRRAARCKMDQL